MSIKVGDKVKVREDVQPTGAGDPVQQWAGMTGTVENIYPDYVHIFEVQLSAGDRAAFSEGDLEVLAK